MECAVCEGALEAMVKILNNPKADHAVEHVLEKTCRALPKKFRNQVNLNICIRHLLCIFIFYYFFLYLIFYFDLVCYKSVRCLCIVIIKNINGG